MRSDEFEDPVDLFRRWFDEAKVKEPKDPNAMALATVDGTGLPSVRMVLLKDAGPAGFTFYTNTESKKGRQLHGNPKAALCFHWKSLGRQVRIEGDVDPVDDGEADAYFATRARDSQIGAWASQQSRPLQARLELERRIATFAAKFALGKVPRPPHWSGYRVEPRLMEFWQERPFRLHERLVYHREADGWRTERQYP